MNENLKKLKVICKDKAKTIKELKRTIREKMQDRQYAGNEQYKLISAKNDYRCHHIAYCLLRGRELHEIERPKKGNEPDMINVNNIYDAYLIEEKENA